MLVEIQKCGATQCRFNRGGHCSSPEIELAQDGTCLTLTPGSDMVPPADMSKMANSGMRMMQNADQMDAQADDGMNEMLKAAGLL